MCLYFQTILQAPGHPLLTCPQGTLVSVGLASSCACFLKGGPSLQCASPQG